MSVENLEKLLEETTKIVASPHVTITEHDRIRAKAIFRAVSEYTGIRSFEKYIDFLEES